MTKREMVQSLSSEYSTRMLCEILGLAPSTYYHSAQGHDDLGLLSLIEDVLLRFPTYGYRRVTEQLHREEHIVNHKRVLRVMRENDLLAIVKQRKRTTQSNHEYSRYPNLVQDVVIIRPDQVWCADITYILLINMAANQVAAGTTFIPSRAALRSRFLIARLRYCSS